MKYNVITFGCKVNNYESEIITEKLNKEYTLVNDFRDADIIIVNTCSVTNNADNKCKKMIRSIKRENKSAILVVVGCSVQNNSKVYEEMEADIILGNKDKSMLPSIISSYICNPKKYIKIYDMKNLEFEDMTVSKFASKTRAFVKIQDGCNNFCSYCIIPYLRGNIRSKDFDVTVKEIKCLVENGHREIVLTGIHTGSYTSNGKTLVDLLEEISKIDNLDRIRISSIEITELNGRFIELLKKDNKICDHLHIPLQSGSNKILKSMNRKYDLQYYKDKIETIRSIRPDISITTDVIVGFPGETDEDFKSCIDFCKTIKFTKIHTFPYSIRTGTKAATLDNQVSEEIKHDRARNLIEISNELETNYYKAFVNKELTVICEETVNGVSHGHTSNYINVTIAECLEKGKEYSIIVNNVDKINVKGVLK